VAGQSQPNHFADLRGSLMWWVLLLSVLLPVTALLGVAALSTLGLEADQVRLKKSYRWLYRWFLPLLRMGTVPNFVQLIKLVQAEAGTGQRASSSAPPGVGRN
jgi:hypothetical protein